MNRKLLIFLVFVTYCGTFKPADPLLVEHALQNESDEGFISREFFQVKVEVPYPNLELSGRQSRETCKQNAFLKKEELALPFLLDVHREQYQWGDGFETYAKTKIGQARLSQSQTSVANSSPISQASTVSPGSNTVTNSMTNVGPNATTVAPQPMTKTLPEQNKQYIQSFGWFFQSMFLYKEDYSSKTKCAFLFRLIQKNLYDKVLQTELPKSLLYKNESIPDEKNTRP
ncbi:hypothetical protein LPTSP4_10850 [Leptospira ryugenii]|uniref:Uncharacterized protein n=1 Tax=Leptospira ryugenii TaxID=1917863 RepID=A0A2P2DY94_9LEPT|nr:hypothetical protein [Leptospira ryugenii]GBF49570.1 hypothetical protein LPTSP4_10850 [Leptospira ryugenii]